MKDQIFPEDKELLNIQQKLQQDSDWILNRIELINLLEKYGEVKIVGAKALGLMVARDIDISVIVSKIDTEVWQEIMSQLMITKHVRKVTAVDEYNYDEENIYDPENGKKYSLYIEMDTILGPDQNKQNPWEIQIHLITKEKFDQKILENLKSKISEINKITILRLKWWANKVNKRLLCESDGHFKIQSVWIYEAVLDKGVIDKAELLAFLSKKLRSDNLKYVNSLENEHE